MAALQEAAEAARGGGERGSTEPGKSRGFENSNTDLTVAGAATVTAGGSRKAMEATTELSRSWQQDMEQSTLPDMSWLQSMWLEGAAGDL
jgi:hypothetical protein